MRGGRATSATWSRPYPPGRGRWWVLAWEAGGLAYLHWTTLRLFEPPAWAGWAIAGLLAALWLAGAWRITVMGVYVGDAGLRVRGLVRTSTVPWTGIDRILVEQVTHAGPFWSINAGKCVVVTRRDGTRLATGLWEQGMDFHASPVRFRALARLLRERHAAAVGRYGDAVRVGRERSSAT